MKRPATTLLTACVLLSCNGYAGSLSDPTRPASARITAVAAPNVLHVEAIIIADSFQWAIINGTVVHAGDHVGNAIIDDISRYSVRYTRNGHSEITLLAHATSIIRRNDTPAEDLP